MYITGNANTAWAIDARTGREIWRYRRTLPDLLRVCCGQVNRGFGILGDLLYMGTLDSDCARPKNWRRRMGRDRRRTQEQQLYARFYQTLDSGDAEACANTFTSDGVWNTNTRGHDALVESNKGGGQNKPMRHSHTNLIITPTPDGATV